MKRIWLASRSSARSIARLLLLTGLPASAAQAQDALVLGGGGARGIAHAGALQGLEARGWDPDFIAGTSMGALIGALYASGISADSVRKVAMMRDWREVFVFAPAAPFPDRPARYPMLQLGLGVDRRRYAEGLVSDARVNRLLVQQLFDAAARARGDFDALPRAYRAVAADLATGEAVVIERGDVARAARASMAVPGVFAPILDHGRTLVDGGVGDYLPVRVARAAGYNRVIAVDVLRPPSDGAQNPLQAAMRAFRLVLMRARIDTVEADVRIVPAIHPDQSAAVFPSDPSTLLRLGREAAEQQAPPGPGTATGRIARPPPSRISRVAVESDDPGLRALTARAFRDLVGPYDARAVLDAADRVYASGLAYGVWPRIEPDPASGDDGVLVVRADAPPPLLARGALAFESDRGARAWGSLAYRPGAGATTVSVTVEHEALRATGAVGVRRPLLFASAFAMDAGVHVTETEVRTFAEDAPGIELQRTGGWAGVAWSRFDPDWRAALVLSAEHVDAPDMSGASIGPHFRLERVEPLGLVVGTPLLLEAESRFGDVGYRRVRASGSFGGALGRLRAAVLLDATATGGTVPEDARPALGDEHLVPGLEWGRQRGAARLVSGLDLAWPIPLDGHARLRLRTGAAARRFSALDETRWTPGLEGGLTFWTPFGRIEGAVGVARHTRPRMELRLGPPF